MTLPYNGGEPLQAETSSTYDINTSAATVLSYTSDLPGYILGDIILEFSSLTSTASTLTITVNVDGAIQRTAYSKANGDTTFLAQASVLLIGGAVLSVTALSDNAGDTTVGVAANIFDRNLPAGLIYGSVSDAGATATDFDTDLTWTDAGHYAGRNLIFISGNLQGQGGPIASGTSPNLTFAASTFTDAPDNGSVFKIA